ncbi:MAG TPA: putative toxin-antitoxin system toxin component, PIN family [Candidatus Margulisbacteria bacterium]|nr:putative toxin-antitoxin system toxin component, PIN family [Candidatus Margulisiibacteriota bacterium]
MRIVLDNNVIVSAFIFKGQSLNFLKKNVSNNDITIITCREIIDELVRILSYCKFNLSPQNIKDILHWYINNTLLVYIDEYIEVVAADPSDNIFISCAVEGNASYIISGDKHLLNLQKFRNVIITSQNKFFP